MSMTLAAGMIAALIAPSAAFAAQSVGRVYDLEAEREGAYVELGRSIRLRRLPDLALRF